MLLVAHRLGRSETRTGLPLDMWLEALSYCGREWFPRVVGGGGVGAPGEGRDVARFTCEWCQRAAWKKRKTLKQCAGCKRVRYCSPACQKSAWKTHKAWCKAHRA